MRRSSLLYGRELLPISAGDGQSGCLQGFLDQLSEAYPDHHLLLVVLDGAPSHRSEEIVCPERT